MGVRELREEVRTKCDHLQALLAFNFSLDKKHMQQLDGIREEAETANAKRLRFFRDVLNTDIRNNTRRIACRLKPSQLVEMVRSQRADEPALTYIPKYLAETLFAGLPAVISEWNRTPAHTFFGFDLGGHFNFPRNTFEYFLPDLLLYRDMCLAYNNAVVMRPAGLYQPAEKERHYAYGFYVRASILSAFYFVEAYLNGLAFDFMNRTLGKDLAPRDLDLLTEWDSKRNKEGWVKFRDKLLQYPKIILGLEEPPLTETNCDEVRILATKAKSLRDSLVHNSPRPRIDLSGNALEAIGSKIRSVMAAELDDATKVVDAAVRFALKINGLLGKKGHKLDWLLGRDQTGLFPESVVGRLER